MSIAKLCEKISYWREVRLAAEQEREACARRKDANGADAYYIQRETAQRCIDALRKDLAHAMRTGS